MEMGCLTLSLQVLRLIEIKKGEGDGVIWKCSKVVKFIELKKCENECLDLMFCHTKIEVSNDLEEL